jgi:hypothetical protein
MTPFSPPCSLQCCRPAPPDTGLWRHVTSVLAVFSPRSPTSLASFADTSTPTQPTHGLSNGNTPTLPAASVLTNSLRRATSARVGGCVADSDAKAAAAAWAMVTSLSLFRLATPTAPTTCSPAISGTPPRSVMSPAVAKACRPLSTLASVSALGRCSKAEVRAFPIARSGLPERTPSNAPSPGSTPHAVSAKTTNYATHPLKP